MTTLKKFLLYLVVGTGLVLVVLVQHISLIVEVSVSAGMLLGIALSGIILVLLFFWQREKQIDDLKYEFLTIITHKFRTPLVSIKWVLHEMRNPQMTHTEREELLDGTAGAVKKLMEVVDNLAGFARSDNRLSYSFEMISLRSMVDTALEKFAKRIRDKDMSFDIAVQPDLPNIRADVQKIQFAVDTLLENAINYTPKGGNVYVDVYVQKKHIYVQVRDTGIGVKRSDKKRIFRKFYRSDTSRDIDPEGLGLALHMVHLIVKKHGGKIWVESKGANKGSTFFIRLPV